MIDKKYPITALLCAIIIGCYPLIAAADGGLGQEYFTWQALKELWAPLTAWTGYTLLLLAVFNLLVFVFIALHIVLLAFIAHAVVKKNFRGKGLRYSAILLVIMYVIVLGIMQYLQTAHPQQQSLQYFAIAPA